MIWVSYCKIIVAQISCGASLHKELTSKEKTIEEEINNVEAYTLRTSLDVLDEIGND